MTTSHLKYGSVELLIFQTNYPVPKVFEPLKFASISRAQNETVPSAFS